MFLPAVKPSSVTHSTLRLLAQFLGVVMLSIDGVVFSGPLFRDGSKVYILHADQTPGDEAVLRFVDIGDRATSEVLDQGSKVAALSQHIQDQRRVLTEQSQVIANLTSTVEGAQKREADLIENAARFAETAEHVKGHLLEALALRHEKENEAIQRAEAANGMLTNTISQIDAMRLDYRSAVANLEQLQGRYERLDVNCENYINVMKRQAGEIDALQARLARYVEAVGPLDGETVESNAPQGINADVQMRLDEIEAEAIAAGLSPEDAATEKAMLSEVVEPAPPPVVDDGPLSERQMRILSDLGSGRESTISREGSVVDNSFRRLLFLTRGDL